MTSYDDSSSLREARQRYFEANGFGEGGYEDRWVKLQAGPLPIFLPNTAARVRAVKLHDLHHAATGYETTWTGEAEIAAWEIASDCGDHYAAWLLNLQAMAIGLVIAPGAMFRAFVRGRHTSNLYRTPFDDALLAENLGSVRQRLRLDRSAPTPTVADRAMFGGWCVLGVVTYLATTLPLLMLPVAFIVWLL